VATSIPREARTVDSLPAALRRDRIATLVQDRGFIRVAELSRIFRTTPVTIRTDLDELTSRGLVRRVHGGAVPMHGAGAPLRPPSQDPREEHKARIGAIAAELVSDGQTIVIAGAPTTQLLARALALRTEVEGVTVLTNDLHVALELQPAIPRFNLILTGGTLRSDTPDLGDPLGGVLLADMRADLSLVGCGGLSAERGLTETSVARVEVTRRLLHAGEHRVVLADAAQIGASSPGRVATAADVDLLVTAEDADAGAIASLRGEGVEVRLVDE
jgi:DeoR family transcriptional regulator, aga operon transcriptional repressor